MPNTSAAMKRIIGVIPPCPCLASCPSHGAGGWTLERLHPGRTGVEDLGGSAQHLGMEGHTLGVEVGAWHGLGVEIPVLVLAAHERGAVAHARRLSDVG